MKVAYYKEFSHELNRDMEFKVYGHAGKPCIVFPAQNGRFYDFEMQQARLLNKGEFNSSVWIVLMKKLGQMKVEIQESV